MASPLKVLQRQFTQSAVGEAVPEFVGAVRGGGQLSAADAVAVYRDGYPARLSEALGETFEGCWRVLGDEDFLAACKVYSRAVHSTSHNLSDYGESFPDFLLERFKDDAPFIRDLGALEWAYKDLFHMAPHAPAEISSGLNADTVLVFGRAVKLLSFDHSVLEMWRRDRSDDTPLRRSDWDAPQTVLLYKAGARALAAAEASILRSLMDGRSIGQALAASKAVDEATVRNLFQFISEAGLITEIR